MAVRVAVAETREEYEAAVEAVRTAADVYENSGGQESVVDDITYDMMMRGLEATEAEHPDWKLEGSPTDRVGGGVAAGGDVKHSVPMLSLDNAFDGDELREWAVRLERVLGRSVSAYTVEPKLDGIALAARYEDGRLKQLVTRGDGTMGEDVTHSARLITGLPAELNERVTIEVRGECFMSDSDFIRANELRLDNGGQAFVNPRNAVAGSMRAKDRTYDVPLSFLAYGVVGRDELDHSAAMAEVKNLGVSVTGDSSAGMEVVSDVEGVLAAIEALGEKRATLGFAVDGAVVKADSAEDRDEAGFTSRAPRWGIAWKYPPDSRMTKLLDIKLQVGRTGAVTPVAVLEPVFVGGTTVASVTLHNAGEIARKGIQVGDTVWVRRAGEVIPEIVSVQLDARPEDSQAWEPPSECPRCGSELDTTQKVWRCTLGRGCGLAESIHYFASRPCMDIEGLGKVRVNSLVKAGLLASVADVYALEVGPLSEVERMGKTSAEKLLEEIEKSKEQPLSRVFAGLGVRLTGTRMSRRLAKHYGSMQALLDADEVSLAEVEGVDKARASSITTELVALKPVIELLAARGVNMDEPGWGEAPTTPQPLKNEDGTPQTVCITGAVPGYGRTEAQELVEKLGGKFASSPSKKTDLVVVGAGAGSKAAKAEALKLTIMSAEDFAALAAQALGG